jgi:hypothetical protein
MDFWIRIRSADIAGWQATNLATHPQSNLDTHLQASLSTHPQSNLSVRPHPITIHNPQSNLSTHPQSNFAVENVKIYIIIKFILAPLNLPLLITIYFLTSVTVLVLFLVKTDISSPAWATKSGK